jgi:uncharacterized protein CbrC (UPF0167 family)
MQSTRTFADLGIPFSLFRGPVEEASEYAGVVRCALCGEQGHCFTLGIGADVVARCPACRAENALDAQDKEGGACRSCGAGVPFPPVAPGDLVACYRCLRGGGAALTKDTELGMIRWEDAAAGVTHGLPGSGIAPAGYEEVPKEDDDDEGWVAVRLPREQMFELVRTPTYLTIQGERWLFCCKHPMAYVGAWSREEFTRRAPDGDGKALFERIVEDAGEGLWEDELHDETGVYVFHCDQCDRFRAHWDIA